MDRTPSLLNPLSSSRVLVFCELNRVCCLLQWPPLLLTPGSSLLPGAFIAFPSCAGIRFRPMSLAVLYARTNHASSFSLRKLLSNSICSWNVLASKTILPIFPFMHFRGDILYTLSQHIFAFYFHYLQNNLYIWKMYTATQFTVLFFSIILLLGSFTSRNLASR